MQWIQNFHSDDYDNTFDVASLGKASPHSPIHLSKIRGDKIFNFVDDGDKIPYRC